jgi:hypothetical protein
MPDQTDTGTANIPAPSRKERTRTRGETEETPTQDEMDRKQERIGEKRKQGPPRTDTRSRGPEDIPDMPEADCEESEDEDEPMGEGR